jgi:O-antigen/teichoic acid export membrane protein
MVQVGLSIVMMGALVGVAFAAPFGSGKRELLIVFAPYVLTQALSVLYALQALERMGSVALIKVITQLATAIPTVALVVATRDPIWVAIGLIFGQLVGDAITFAVLGRHNFRFTAPDLSAFIPLIKGGTALLSSLLLFNYLATIDIPILSAFRSSHQVGLYSAATRLVATAAIVSQVLITAVLPELVRRHMQGRERLRAFAEQLVALTSRVTLACTGMVIVESGAIVRLLYGAQYRPSSALLAILVPIVPLVWYGHLLGYVQVAAGRQRDFAVSLGVACAAATVAFPVTAGLWGSKGLAIALTATYLLQAAAFAFLLARHLDSSVIVAAVRQLPYALIPIIVLLIAHAVSRDSLLTAVPLWLAAVIAVEAAARWPTVAALGAIRPAQPG